MSGTETRTYSLDSHYVVHITIEEVTKTKIEPVYRNQGEAKIERGTSEIAKIVVKDKELNKLVEKTIKHLGIVQGD